MKSCLGSRRHAPRSRPPWHDRSRSRGRRADGITDRNRLRSPVDEVSKIVIPASIRPIDCDVHLAVPSTRALLPYLDDYWREHIIRRGIDGDNLELSAYPPNAPP